MKEIDTEKGGEGHWGSPHLRKCFKKCYYDGKKTSNWFAYRKW